MDSLTKGEEVKDEDGRSKHRVLGDAFGRGAVEEEQILMSINCVSPVSEIQIDPGWLRGPEMSGRAQCSVHFKPTLSVDLLVFPP